MTFTPSMSREEFEKQSDEEKKEGLVTFLSDPLTKIVISSIPSGDNQDALLELLKSAFNKGYDAGQASMMLGVMRIRY